MWNWKEISKALFSAGPALFMERYAAYEFAFVVEGDVRYTGRDWGHFFNSVFNIGTQALNSKPKEEIMFLEGVEDGQQKVDFITFFQHLKQPIEPTNENLQDNSTWKYPKVMYHMLQIYGISRKMNSIVVKESKKGNGGYLEQFLPSTALLSDLNAVTISLGMWIKEHPLHCCVPRITEMYNQWYLNGTCMASIPLHPVKNNGSMWEMPPALWRI